MKRSISLVLTILLSIAAFSLSACADKKENGSVQVGDIEGLEYAKAIETSAAKKSKPTQDLLANDPIQENDWEESPLQSETVTKAVATKKTEDTKAVTTTFNPYQQALKQTAAPKRNSGAPTPKPPVNNPAASPATQQQEAGNALWTIEVAGGKVSSFTNIDFEKMGSVTISTTRTKSNGDILNDSFTGVLMSKLFQYIANQNYKSVIVEASDGYKMVFQASELNKDFIFANKVNGAPLSEKSGPLQAVVNNGLANRSVKCISKMTIN